MDEALSVGVMVVQMVTTVIFAPIVVSIAIRGAETSAWAVAQSLILFMLLPLGSACWCGRAASDWPKQPLHG